MPISGDHSRHAGGARNTSPVTVARVTSAATGAAAGAVPSGTCVSASNTRGITVTAINMITVPETTGVKMRRNSGSRAASRNWNIDETTMRLAIVAGPPTFNAVTQTAINAPEVPMMSTCPAPNRPTRAAWRTVVAPLTSSAAKMAHDR